MNNDKEQRDQTKGSEPKRSRNRVSASFAITCPRKS